MNIVVSLPKKKNFGLTTIESRQRLQKYGPNRLTAKEARWYHILGRQFKTSFIYLLVAASAVSLFLGEVIDAVFIIIFVSINAMLGFWQEYHSALSLRRLKGFVSEKTHVIRDGKIEFIDNAELVPGDVVALSAGDKIPADVKFIEARGVTVDESILTGESEPVGKSEAREDGKGKKDNESLGYSGTLLSTGEAKAEVTATGNNTEVGHIAKTALETRADSAFQHEMNLFSKFILRLVVITILATLVLQFAIRGEDYSFVKFIVFSIALAVGVIPEALPLVITTALSRGALRLAKKHVVPRRLAAIEDLGNMDTLCTDKTGTITENKMRVDKIWGREKEVLRLALTAAPFIGKKEARPNNSFDIAVWKRCSKKLRNDASKVQKIADLPFDPDRRRNSVLVKVNDTTPPYPPPRGELEESITSKLRKMNGYTLIVRGAAEELCGLCDDFGEYEKRKLLETIREEGKKGRRMLAVATKRLALGEEAAKKVDIRREEKNLTFTGLLAFADPLKPSAAKAIHDATHLGIQVKIITGDSREVAGNVAQSIGLVKSANEVITGDELERLSDQKQREAALKFHVFARVSPLQKFKIVNLLKEKHFVGFLGEGFNDAPALKAAHVALSVDNASDIAKDTADVVLLNPSLHVIIDGVKEGRKIFTNSFTYIKATLISNFGNFYALVFASLIITFLPMLPLQILLLNLLTDFPMIAIAADNVDSKELRKPKGFRVKEVVLAASILGLVSTAFDFAFFGYFLRFGERNLQTMWFMGSVITELLLIFSIRRRGFFLKGARPSGFLIALTAAILPLTLALPFTRFGQQVFSFSPQPISSLLMVLALAGGYLVTTETVKLMYNKLMTRADARLPLQT